MALVCVFIGKIFFASRIEAIMRKMQSRVPFLSEPERNMKRELESMDEKLETYQRNLEQVRGFIDWPQSLKLSFV